MHDVNTDRGRVLVRSLGIVVMLSVTCCTASKALCREPFRIARPLSDSQLEKKRNELLENRLTLSSHYPTYQLSFPYDWSNNPHGNQNWMFLLHAMRWLQPLIDAHVRHRDEVALTKARDVIRHWIAANPRDDPPSRHSWSEHATAWRAILFANFWLQYRKSDIQTDEFQALFLASIREHGRLLASSEFYVSNHNHGLNQNAALLALSLGFPALEESARWYDVAIQRLAAYVQMAFSDKGVHLEQAPAYHRYALQSLMRIAAFLQQNNRGDHELLDAIRTSYDVLPYLVDPTGHFPPIGDSGTARILGKDINAGQADLLGLPRLTEVGFFQKASRKRISDFRDANYVVCRKGRWFDQDPSDDYFLFLKTGSRVSASSVSAGHAHFDGASFVLYAHGGYWFIDSGKYTYNKGAYRTYMKSSLAHNTLSFPNLENRSSEADVRTRTQGDTVSIRLERKSIPHTREILIKSNGNLGIRDEAPRTGGLAIQSFHVHPDHDVRIRSDGTAEVEREDGLRCRISQHKNTKQIYVRLARGQTGPPLGWYSEEYLEKVPTSTIQFIQAKEPAVFVTKIEFHTRQTSN